MEVCFTFSVMHRQWGCEEREDVLRPYSHLNYAWDEPSLPHKLVMALPGNRVLGTFNMDRVSCSEIPLHFASLLPFSICSQS
jgi:hypothetical protein